MSGAPLSWSDHVAVSELLSDYGLLLDRREMDRWAALFEPDAVIEITGRAPITTDGGRRSMVVDSPRGLHLAAPVLVRATNDDGTVEAEQSFLFYNLETGKVLAGWYDDVLALRDGTWRFAQRAIRLLPRKG